MNSNVLWNDQQALTEGLAGVEDEARLLFPQSLPFLASKAVKNLLLASLTNGCDDEEVRLQGWSAGNLCLRQTWIRQVLQVLVLEKVKIPLHLLTGQVGFFFFLGSQSPDSSCFRNIALWSSTWQPVVSMDIEQISQTKTIRLLKSDFGHSWDLHDLCSTQNTCTEDVWITIILSKQLFLWIFHTVVYVEALMTNFVLSKAKS